MIYFLHGTDIDKGRTKAHELVNSLLLKKPDASFFRMSSENWDEGVLEGYIGGQGLFEKKYIIFLDRLCDDKDIKEVFLSKIKSIAESENIFIILEGKLDKASSGKIEKKAEKTVVLLLPEQAKKEYNAFALADALGSRDRKNAWVLYRKAIDKGEAPEALHGMLFWKVKTMLLNSYSSTYNKDELYGLADSLVTVLHDSRRGKYELETRLERLILSL